MKKIVRRITGRPRIDHYVITQNGGWDVEEGPESYTLTGTIAEGGIGGDDDINVTITIDRKTGEPGTGTCVWAGTTQAAIAKLGKAAKSPVVLVAVDTEGNKLSDKTITFRQFDIF